MGLANVRFAVEMLPMEPGEHGADAVRFVFSQSRPGDGAPAEVASGGEMSRSSR